MQRRFWLAAVLLCSAGCGAEEDDRPQTAEYIITTILAPTCGRTGCHSDATRWNGYAFDTLANGREALDELVRAGRPDQSVLYNVITGEDPEMPPEGPLPKKDIALIRAWIESGAEGIER